jgi:hypothetical protein
LHDSIDQAQRPHTTAGAEDHHRGNNQADCKCVTAASCQNRRRFVHDHLPLLCDTTVALLLYNLLRPVSRNLSFLAAAFRLIFVAVMAVNSLNYFGFLDIGYDIALVPFGAHCLLMGILIFQSEFLSRLVGILLALAGLGYLTFLWPPLGQRLFIPYILVLALAAEVSLTLWLLFIGVNTERWTQQASAARQ